ncbi:MAG: GPGG-motif small membrane protein [Candidatus Nanopelagicales bacterium]
MTLLLLIIAIFCFVAGVRDIIRGKMLSGVVLIIVGLLIGPGGVSIFH